MPPRRRDRYSNVDPTQEDPKQENTEKIPGYGNTKFSTNNQDKEEYKRPQAGDGALSSSNTN